MEPAESILLVDDDESYRFILRHHLEGLGYRVLEAGDGNEALSILCDRPIPLAILDLVMPNGEGLETIRILRRKGWHTKVLAVSGARAAHTYLDAASKLGADAAVEKARPVSELLDTVRLLLNREDGSAVTREVCR